MTPPDAGSEEQLLVLTFCLHGGSLKGGDAARPAPSSRLRRIRMVVGPGLEQEITLPQPKCTLKLTEQRLIRLLLE